MLTLRLEGLPPAGRLRSHLFASSLEPPSSASLVESRPATRVNLSSSKEVSVELVSAVVVVAEVRQRPQKATSCFLRLERRGLEEVLNRVASAPSSSSPTGSSRLIVDPFRPPPRLSRSARPRGSPTNGPPISRSVQRTTRADKSRSWSLDLESRRGRRGGPSSTDRSVLSLEVAHFVCLISVLVITIIIVIGSARPPAWGSEQCRSVRFVQVRMI